MIFWSYTKPMHRASRARSTWGESSIDQDSSALRALNQISGHGNFGQRVNAILENQQFCRPTPGFGSGRRNCLFVFREKPWHSTPLEDTCFSNLFTGRSRLHWQTGTNAHLHQHARFFPPVECTALRDCRQGLHPSVNLRGKCEHSASLCTSWPANRQREFRFPPLHRSYSRRKIVGNFFPAVQNLMVVRFSIHHAHRSPGPFLFYAAFGFWLTRR